MPSPNAEHAGPHLPAELELLLACGRSSLDEVTRRWIRTLAASEIPWDGVVDAAWGHALLPLVYRHLSRVASHLVPPSVMESLAVLDRRNVADALALTHELVDILRALTRDGVVVLPYKGPLLAQRLYGDVSLRQAGDLDLLVRPQDFLRAREILAHRGYRPRVPLTPPREALLRRAYCNQVLDRDGVATVELHWRFTNPSFAFPLDLDDLLPVLREGSLGGTPVLDLADEELLLVLAVHGSKHRWSRLEWIAGVGELLRSADGLDWDRVMKGARSSRSARRLYLALHLAWELTGTPLPTHMSPLVLADRRVVRLAHTVRDELIHRHRRGVLRGTLPLRVFQLRLLEGGRDRLRLLTHLLTHSDEADDWWLVPVGSRHLPAHVFLRPFQAAGKVGRRALQGLIP